MDTKAPLPRRPNALGVHSLNRFAFSVPDLAPAEKFYAAFGLDTRRDGNRLDVYTHGHKHRWGSIYADGKPKKLQYLSFGAYEEDFDALRKRIAAHGAAEPHPLADDKGEGVWTRDADGTPIQVVVAPKVSPSAKSQATQVRSPPGKGAAPSRSGLAPVRPRHLSHVLLFTPDVLAPDGVLRRRPRPAAVRPLGRHHRVHARPAFERPSPARVRQVARAGICTIRAGTWASIDEVGLGAEQMSAQGYAHGWGVGRHVLGSNYFYYAQDPWGSWAEYSYDIDFVPADVEWPASDHPPEDSFYVWGPPVPDDFITNHEQPRTA